MLEKEDIDIHCGGGHDLGGMTPLQYASWNGQEWIMRMLLDHLKIDITHASDALWNAVYNSLNSRPIEILPEYEVDPNGLQNGQSLLETTVRRGLNDIPIQDERVNINCSFASGEIDEPVVLVMVKFPFVDQTPGLFK